jgi:hypothetical protein
VFDAAEIDLLLDIHRMHSFAKRVAERAVEIGVNGKFAGTVAIELLPCA